MAIKITPYEEEIILELRKVDIKKYEQKRLKQEELYLRRIKAACQFAYWMAGEDVGPSYSRFCDGDNFGYVPKAGEDIQTTYNFVMNILREAGNYKYMEE